MFKIIPFLLSAALVFMTAPIFSQENSSSSNLDVKLVVAADVQDRVPVGEADSFSSDTTSVVAWTHVKGAKEPTDVTHEWSHDGKVIATVPLNIRSSNFRTWSRKTLYGLTGSWKIEVKDDQGNVLASKAFEVPSQTTP